MQRVAKAWGTWSVAVSVAAASALTASRAAAQEPASTDKAVASPAPVDAAPKLAGISVLGGVMLVDWGPVNDRLSRAGYSEKIPLAFPMLGGQGFGLFSYFYIGGSGAGLFERTVDGPNGTRVSASGAWGTFDFGYQAVRRDGFLLVPILSLGGYGMAVNVASKADTSFDDAIAMPTRATSLTNQGGIAGLSVLAKFVVIGRRAQVRDAKSGWALGLRVGGLYGIPFGDWHADDAKAEDGPSLGLRGGYAALSLGVGTW